MLASTELAGDGAAEPSAIHSSLEESRSSVDAADAPRLATQSEQAEVAVAEAATQTMGFYIKRVGYNNMKVPDASSRWQQ